MLALELGVVACLIVLVRLGRFPRLGDTFEFGSWRFEVIDIDRRRIDKVLAQPLRKPMIAP